MGGLFANKNPMMTYDPTQGLQMPINNINPNDLSGNPQALYAYNQMRAALQSGQGSNPAILDPAVMARQRAIMQIYFPQMRNLY